MKYTDAQLLYYMKMSAVLTRPANNYGYLSLPPRQPIFSKASLATDLFYGAIIAAILSALLHYFF